MERLALDLPPTLETNTRRGRHLIFRARLPFQAPARLGDGLDVKGNCRGRPTGYLIAPASTVGGHVYEWRNDLPIAPAPPELIVILRSATRRATPNFRYGQPIARGERNSMLTQLAGALRRNGFAGIEEIEAALKAANVERCRPPLPDQEIATIASSAAKWDAPPLWITDPITFTEDERLAPIDRHVLWILSSYAKVDSWARPGIRTIARRAGCTPKTVHAAIDRLEAAGRIEVRRSRKGNRYLIRPFEATALTTGTSVVASTTARQDG